MSTAVVIALDVGSQSIRASAYDRAGRCVLRPPSFKLTLTHDGTRCRTPSMMLVNGIDEVLAVIALQLATDFKACAMGITCQRESIAIWGADGRLMPEIVSWRDTSAPLTVPDLAQWPNDPDIYIPQITGLPHDGQFSVSKIKAYMPPGGTAGTVTSLVLKHLTGSWIEDVTSAHRTNLVRLSSPYTFDPELLKLWEIEDNQLPRICHSVSSKLATVMAGAFQGIPVTAILGDQQASAVGHGMMNNPAVTKITFGTGAFICRALASAASSNSVKLTRYGVQTTLLVADENRVIGMAECSIRSAGAAVANIVKQGGMPTASDLDVTVRQGKNASVEEIDEAVVELLGQSLKGESFLDAVVELKRPIERKEAPLVARRVVETLAEIVNQKLSVMDEVLGPSTVKADGGLAASETLRDAVNWEESNELEMTSAGIARLAWSGFLTGESGTDIVQTRALV